MTPHRSGAGGPKQCACALFALSGGRGAGRRGRPRVHRLQHRERHLWTDVCAERVAVFKAISEGARKFQRIAVAADTDVLTPPCGACRQILWEFCGDIEVTLTNLHGKTETLQLERSFPEAFRCIRLFNRGARTRVRVALCDVRFGVHTSVTRHASASPLRCYACIRPSLTPSRPTPSTPPATSSP